MDLIEDEEASGRPKPLDVESLLSNMIPTLLGQSRKHIFHPESELKLTTLTEYPFLQGRAFVFASQYSKLLPSQMTGQYLEAAVQVVENAEAGVPVKVSAIKAIHK